MTSNHKKISNQGFVDLTRLKIQNKEDDQLEKNHKKPYTKIRDTLYSRHEFFVKNLQARSIILDKHTSIAAIWLANWGYL